MSRRADSLSTIGMLSSTHRLIAMRRNEEIRKQKHQKMVDMYNES